MIFCLLEIDEIPSLIDLAQLLDHVQVPSSTGPVQRLQSLAVSGLDLLDTLIGLEKQICKGHVPKIRCNVHRRELLVEIQSFINVRIASGVRFRSLGSLFGPQHPEHVGNVETLHDIGCGLEGVLDPLCDGIF